MLGQMLQQRATVVCVGLGCGLAVFVARLLLQKRQETNGEDEALKKRAARVLASLTHMSTERMPSNYRQFFSHGKGCHVTDVEGKTYVDYMASFGPILLGHCDPAVEKAVRRQQEKGLCLTGPSARMVELAELLVETVPFADWAYFCKNGTDATTAAVRIARAKTGKRIILRAPASYHGGAGLWQETSSFKGGVLPEEHAYQLSYKFNDIESFRAAADEAGDDFAGVICAAFRWDFGEPQELPNAEFLQELRKICDDRGAVLICDDVRSSLRIDLRGSWAAWADISPDLICLCKGIANGYPLACVLGSDPMREGVRTMARMTGSFWCNGDAFAASIATIRAMKSSGGIEKMVKLGRMLQDGLITQAKALGLSFHVSGPPQMPFFSFPEESSKPLLERTMILSFCNECVSRGVWFHPFHTMFFTTAHTEADIAYTLLVSKQAFEAVAAMRGAK